MNGAGTGRCDSPVAVVASRTGRTALPLAGASTEAEVLRKAVAGLHAQLDDLVFLAVRRRLQRLPSEAACDAHGAGPPSGVAYDTHRRTPLVCA